MIQCEKNNKVLLITTELLCIVYYTDFNHNYSSPSDTWVFTTF